MGIYRAAGVPFPCGFSNTSRCCSFILNIHGNRKTLWAKADAIAQMGTTVGMIPREVKFLMIAEKAIGKPDLPYVQVSGDEFGGVLLQIRMSMSMSDLLVEMAGALDSGFIKPTDARSARNTTPTSYETLVCEVFLPVSWSLHPFAECLH
jgi:hypothetical protein